MPTTVPEQNFQPQTRDTTNGPNVHTYIPRADGSIMIGGIAYIPLATANGPAAVPAPATATIPVTAAAAAVPLPTPPIPMAAPPVYPPQQPMFYPQQPYVAPPQPAYQPQYQMPYQAPYGIQPQPYVGGYPAFNIGQAGYGQTGGEVLAGQMALAQESDINKKQEMKPADDDPFRMYWCRELDGTWTQRNRLTIDSGDIGDCRWYSMDGQFYAVRLSDG